MRSNIPFDTHAFVKRLVAAGVPEPQAEVHADALAELIDNQLATKRDLEALEKRLDGKLKTLELRLKHDLTLRFGGMLAAAVAVLAVLMPVL